MENRSTTTHEPKTPLPNYPFSHVNLEDVFQDSCAECVKVTIHGHAHFLHRTTAFSLYEQLQTYFKNLSPAEKLILIQFGSQLGPELINTERNYDGSQKN